MSALNTLAILITAKDTASAVFDSTARNLESNAAKMESSGTRIGAIGGNMTKFVTLPILAVAGASIKMAADFQSSMTRLVTSAGESDANLKAVSSGVLQVARDTGTSTDELAKAMYTIESGGQHGADGLKVLQAAAEGAKTENADLKTVADAVTSVLVDYHLKATDATTVTTKLVAATSAGKTSFENLAGAMPAILPVASAAHVSLNDILGDLAAMTIHGMSAEQSTQDLSDVIRHMQNPTAMQAKELALLGLTTTQLAGDLQTHGLSGTLQEISGKIANLMPAGSDKVILNLKTALSGLSPKVRDLGMHLFDGTMSAKDYGKAAAALDPISAKQAASFATLAGSTHRIGDQQMTGAQVMQNYGQALAKATGDATGLNVALMLSGENAGTVNGAIKTVSSASNEAGGHVKGWADIQKTFNYHLGVFKETLSTSAITLGTKMLPALTDALKHVTNGVQDVIKWYTGLSPWQKDFIKDVGIMVVVGGPAIIFLSKVATGVKAIADVGSGTIGFFKGLGDSATLQGKIASGAIDGVQGGVKSLWGMLSANPVMGGIATAGALADIALVANAVGAVQRAIKDMNSAQSSIAKAADQTAAIKDYQAQYNSGKITKTQETKSINAILQGVDTAYAQGKSQNWSGHALGTNFAPGGRTLVGEHGPEMVDLPTGSKVTPARQTQQALGSSKSVNIGNFNVYNQIDTDVILRKIGMKLATA